MLVLKLESPPPKVVGYCSSWALQVATHVFVANLPAKARDEIWSFVTTWATKETKAIMIWPAKGNEQRLRVRTLGKPRRRVVSREGLLISTWIPIVESLEVPEDSPYLAEGSSNAKPDIDF